MKRFVMAVAVAAVAVFAAPAEAGWIKDRIESRRAARSCSPCSQPTQQAAPTQQFAPVQLAGYYGQPATTFYNQTGFIQTGGCANGTCPPLQYRR